MADIRIKDLATTATTTASDDFMAVDGVTNGTRKLSAATPAFLTSVTTPSLTSPASTNLTLAGGAGNSSIILTPAGTGNVGIGTTTPTTLLQVFKTQNAQTGINILNQSTGTGAYTALSQTTNNGTSYLYTFGSSYTTSGRFIQDSMLLEATLAGGLTLAATHASGPIRFYAGGTLEKVRIDTTGNVSIASTTASTGVSTGALQVAGGIYAGAASVFGGGLTVGGAIYSSSFLDATGGVGTPVSGHGQFSGSGTYGAVIAGYGSTYDFALFNRSGVDVLHVATNTTTVAFSGAATFAGAVTVVGNIVGSGTANQFNAVSAELKLGSHANTTTSPILSMSTGGAGGNSNLIKFYTGGVDLNAQIKNPVSSQTLEIYAATTLAATFATTGTTFAGTVIAPAATASLAPLRIPHGTAPTSPTNGDMWTTTAGLYIRINGATVGPLS